VVGNHLGTVAKHFMNAFSIILLLLVGVVFVLSPASLLGDLTSWSVPMWIAIIFGYYILATVVPVDKIIGRLYPIFGALLLFMSAGLLIDGQRQAVLQRGNGRVHQHASNRAAIVAAAVHHYRLWRGIRLPRYPITTDGALHAK
jgi:carbon starvation protein CstA